MSKINEYLNSNIAPQEITLSKKQFVTEHTSDNIRDDYLIGKVLGTGKLAI